ncbi:hypothetical protein IAI10_16460 [Clostridium sp. 19966]|uniref:hypothetical protein n=1 Tax=Clostridium sp. 19966 TaxID=2768166 RepID=UPI0028E01524|nr:hypothetical protein [Clostridium sp. 19966]MDT8718261.1 hypothetical protein [Clostridium sp. 19966]
MGWYYGTFSCGHEGRVNIIGPTKDRQWKADSKFNGLCSECYEKHLQEQREKANKEAAEKAKEMELPALKGTDKQIAYAETLRLKFADKFNNLDKKAIARIAQQKYMDAINEIADKKGKEYANQFIQEEVINKVRDYILENETSAKFYIECWDNDIMYFVLKVHDKVLVTEEEKIEEKIKEEIKMECAVKPQNNIHPGVVDIIVKDDTITAKYEKNEDFIKTVKSLCYKWDGVWSKKIRETNGFIEDRAAELGNKLLNAGFTVSILDAQIRENAVKGIYEPECKRWIMLYGAEKYKGWLAIGWRDESDLYNTARKLPTSKWDNPYVVVKIEHYKEVEEFARLYGFKFSSSALKAIERYKEQLNSIDTVQPIKVTEQFSKNGLKEILNSSTEVLDDLKED